MRPQFAEKNIALQLQLPKSLPNIYADHDRTEQILTNLLGNALQYTETGGTVAVDVVPNDHTLHFTVRDSGIGLKAEDTDRIFQRFYRVDKSRSRSSGGSGIGLTITRHLVEVHGGRIWAESPGLGQGSTFHFTLPAV
jgi:histidine kinase